MADRVNYQQCNYQRIRPGELWQCNWLEETGKICSLLYDIKESKIIALPGFSKIKLELFLYDRCWHRLVLEGHWEHSQAAHGNKRQQNDFERWRGLAEEGKQTDRVMLSEQAVLVESFRGGGDLKPIAPNAQTF